VYRHVLSSKGAVFLLQQQRRLFARLLAARDGPQAHLAGELRQATRALATLSLAPANGKDVTSQRRRLEALTREKEELEARLASLSADYRDSQKQADVPPAQLRASLPQDVALIDFLFYIRHDHTQIDAKKRFQRHLTAFVVRPDHPVVRVELGQASAV